MMIRIALLAFAFSGWIGTANAQQGPVNDGLSAGFQVSQYQQDFGVGLNLTSPYLANGKFAIRLRGHLMYNEHVEDNETTWTPYANATLGLIGGSGPVGGFARLYGEGGLIGLFPSDDFSSEDFVFGGYGLFGFEFFMSRANSFFLEVGGVGTGATADQIPTRPIYSNGLTIGAGYRIYL